MAVQISGNDITVPRDGSFTRNVTIGGTLTYEDVTNIDSVGLVTARNGIEIGARPGVAASISVDGNMIVSGISTFGGDVQVPDKIIHSGDTNTAIRFPADDTVSVETSGSETLRLNSTGQILVGTTSDGGSYDGVTPKFVSEANSAYHAYSFVVNSTNAGHSGILQFVRSRGTSDGANTIVQDGDRLGSIYGIGADGTNRDTGAAAIDFRVDGTPGENDMPGRIEFRTTADGAASPTERLRITSGGKLIISNHGTNDLRSLSVLAPKSQIQFGTANDVGGFLMSSNNGQFGLSGGAYFNGTSWVATHTGSTQIRTDGDGDISFCTNTSLTSGNTFTPSEKVTFNSDGDVTIVDGDLVIGTSGHGIDFSAASGSAAGSASAILDDYEEGTYTPTISSGMASISYEDQSGNYVKTGKLVEFNFFIRIATGSYDTNGNHLKISLPFNQSTSNLHRGFGIPTYHSLNSLNVNNDHGLHLYINSGNAEFYSGSVAVSGGNGSNQGGRYIIGGGMFHVA